MKIKYIIGLVILLFLLCTPKHQLTFETKTFVKEQPVPGQPDMTISVKCRWPVFDKNNGFIAEINESISQFSKSALFEGTVYSSLDDLWQTVMLEHQQQCEEMPDFIRPYSLERICTIKRQTARLLVLEMSEYSYTGGAHPNGALFFDNYDLKGKKKIKLDDIIQNNATEKLRILAESEFRKLKAIPQGMSLNENGFNFENDTFSLSHTFALEEEGILFYYNVYDIAPYVMGPTELLLSYAKLKDLIISDYLP